MLAGEPPFSAETPMGVAIKHISDPVPDIRSTRPELPTTFTSILSTALAKKPADRYASAGAFAPALTTATSQIVAPSTVILSKTVLPTGATKATVAPAPAPPPPQSTEPSYTVEKNVSPPQQIAGRLNQAAARNSIQNGDRTASFQKSATSDAYGTDTTVDLE